MLRLRLYILFRFDRLAQSIFCEWIPVNLKIFKKESKYGEHYKILFGWNAESEIDDAPSISFKRFF